MGDERLKSEVLRVYGNLADLQVFEETVGVRYGDRVELTIDAFEKNAEVTPSDVRMTVPDGTQVLHVGGEPETPRSRPSTK